ncbi:hypothetical protein LTR37_012478 [Vermiconidia calcicola]|uniref:Uncharacterized protein n=1 Tax=Vermiconidia calcicola TaxID=1690605 RepID=A0ACC3MZF4_9PEZI|nr:hypothetical protein LTR37_012478 [Vermiconidia calcicola]
MSGVHNSWYLDRTRRAQPNSPGQMNVQYTPQDIMRRAPGYLPYQSMADTSGRYAYNAASGRAYPRQAAATEYLTPSGLAIGRGTTAIMRLSRWV